MESDLFHYMIEMTSTDANDILDATARSIRPFSMDIKRAMYDDGVTYIGIINTVRIHFV